MTAVASSRASLLAQTTGESALERRLRARVRAAGALGYRKGYRLRSVPGLARRSADIAWPGLRLAVFVDGCFWHCCPEHQDRRGCSPFWLEKFRRNKERDEETTLLLECAGWRVLRLWEHLRLDEALERVLRARTEAMEARRSRGA